MPEKFEFEVPATAAPLVEINDAGLYIRFKVGETATKTIVRNEWPHVAVDLARDGSVIGVELVPLPERFSIGRVAREAGIRIPPEVLGADPEIQPQALQHVADGS
jgi:hypothetical protein